MLTNINTSYAELLSNRRSLNAPLWYKDSGDSYSLFVELQNIIITSDVIKDSDNGLDFDTNRKPFSNKIVSPAVLEIKSHDFCDPTNWIYSPENSLYCIQPLPGKSIKLQRAQVVCDKAIDLNTQQVHFILWESILAPCPNYVSGTVTAASGEGWVAVYPTPPDVQEVEVRIYLSDGYPLYKATVFTYNSIQDLLIKSTQADVGSNLYCLSYNYYLNNTNVCFRSSLNERLELFLSGDTPLLTPNSEFCRATFMFDSYDEF